MRGWLLDTNVISELRKPACHPRVRNWIRSQPPDSLFISPVTLAEIRFGIEQTQDAHLRARLAHWLEWEVRPWFDNRILDIDEEVLLVWWRKVKEGRKRNLTYSQPDLFIAATASVYGLKVATRNTKDFELAGVAVYNPWEALV